MNKITVIVLAAACIAAETAGPARGQTPTYIAGNLGIYYVPIVYSNGSIGLRLTAPPIAGSPAAQLGLEAGDVIFALDGQRFTRLSEVANHVDQTTVDFIDVRTNAWRRGIIFLPSAPAKTAPAPQAPALPKAGAPPAAMAGNRIGQQVNGGNWQPFVPNVAQPGPRPQLAQNLGVWYVPNAFTDGTFGLRLTRAPLPGSPAAQLQLEAGDIIYALDGQRFTTLNDVASHFDETTVDFIVAETNTQQQGTITLPSQGS